MGEPVFTVQQAAEAIGVSRSTVYRAMEDLMEHGATRDGKTTYIPFSALIATGLAPSTSPPDNERDTSKTSLGTRKEEPVETRETLAEEHLRERLAEAENRIKDLEHAKSLAEAIAAERERVIEVQSRALRLLEAGPSSFSDTSRKRPETEFETTAETAISADENGVSRKNDTILGPTEMNPETSSEAENETPLQERTGGSQDAPEGVSGVGVAEAAQARSKRWWWPF